MTLYDNLADVDRASLLNIIAKARSSKLDSSYNVMHFMKEILAVNPDSILAVVSKGIIDEAEDSVGEGLLFQISSALHNPPAGFVKKGSFRTPDRYGSLQFTLFAKGDYCIARIDIDDQGGFKHLMDVLGGKFDMRETTHPYDINQLLVYYQRIDPGYRLRP